MHRIVIPSNIKGRVTAPPSKSVTQRMYAAALLRNGTTTITGAGTSGDETTCLNVLRQAGAIVNEVDDKVVIQSKGHFSASKIDCGESGLATRLFAPIAAISNELVTINGSGSLLNRSMSAIVDVLAQFGVQVSGHGGKLPLQVKGPLSTARNNIVIDGSEGSQVISGLLLALSKITTQAFVFSVNNAVSKPYIDLTIDVLAQFGCRVEHQEHACFTVYPRVDEADDLKLQVEGDWSGAANFLVAGTISGSVTVDNLKIGSAQADKAILDVLTATGCNISYGRDEVITQKSELKAFQFDATDCPDLFPILAVLATCCTGESSITGVNRLRNKESDRAATISNMLGAFGVVTEITNDTMRISGTGLLQACTIDACNDHRIAMAGAVAALRASGPVTIIGAEAVNKSFPSFWETLTTCGINVV